MNNPPVETTICVSYKDFNKLPYMMPLIEKYVDTVGFRIITPDPSSIPDLGNINLPVHVHADDEIMKFDRSRFSVRPNWMMQQFLKLFQDVTETEWFFAVDADLFFNKKVSLFDDEGHPLFLLSLEQPESATSAYFDFSKKMIGVDRVYSHTFVGESTLYNKALIKRMLSDNGYASPYEFIERAAQIIAAGCFPADAELYGSYVWKHHPGIYRTRQLNSWMGGIYDRKYKPQEIEERMALVSADVDVFTMHTWEWYGVPED